MRVLQSVTRCSRMRCFKMKAVVERTVLIMAAVVMLVHVYVHRFTIVAMTTRQQECNVCGCVPSLQRSPSVSQHYQSNKVESARDIHDIPEDELDINTRLQYYPKGGTGESVDTSQDFDQDIFNSFCITNKTLRAVIPIYSATDRFRTRCLLRHSLGEWAKKLNCKIFFIVGISHDHSVNLKLQEEYMKELDILVVGKIDTYRDLNNKALAMMEWIHKYCSHVPYVIHSIDDTYFNLEVYLRRIDGITDEYWMFGPVADTPAVRDHPKSSVTVEEYPYPRFPPYTYGWAYAFSSRTAGRLLQHVYNATYCWIEDVWIAGDVRVAANVSIVQSITREEWLQTDEAHKLNISVLPSQVVLHSVQPDLLYTFFTRAYNLSPLLKPLEKTPS